MSEQAPTIIDLYTVMKKCNGDCTNNEICDLYGQSLIVVNNLLNEGGDFDKKPLADVALETYGRITQCDATMPQEKIANGPGTAEEEFAGYDKSDIFDVLL